VGVKETFKIGVQDGKIGRTFQVEVSPVRQQMARKCALPALARPDEEHGWKGPQEGAKIFGLLAIEISHTL
jgi:hypothetical protein